MSDLTEKIKLKSKILPYNTDTTFKYEDIRKRKTINSFMGGQLLIKELAYFCFKGWTVRECKYKLTVKYDGKKIKYRDREYRTRSVYGKANNLLHLIIPNSKFITDINGDIYLLLDFKEEQNLYKIKSHKK